MPAKYHKGKMDFNITKRADELLKKFGIWDRRNFFPNKISGGQQQRVAIARALINQPAIILGDEPTGDLDSSTSSDVMDLFRRINRVNQQTLILVTHSRWIAEKCDYIVHMSDGQISGTENNQKSMEAKR